MLSSTNILEMKSISKSFGATHALRNIEFELKKGEVHALLGENGAGKSTLIKVLGGIHNPDTGEILINGNLVNIDSVKKARELGIGIIHQEIMLVPHLSIMDNLFLGREIINTIGVKNSKEMENQAKKMLETIGLNINVHKRVEELNIAQQQMIEIAKAISFDAKILVMDEPTSSLSEEEVQKLFDLIKLLKSKEVSIIYISHRLDELFAVSDRITVIRDGSYIDTVLTQNINSAQLVSMMVGRNLENFYVRDNTVKEDIVLSVNKLTSFGVFNDVTFEVKAGEILGFSGLVGAGRSEIMDAIFGASSFDSGEIHLLQNNVKFRKPIDAIKAGIAMVPEDRKKQGLNLIGTVGFNITLASLDNYRNQFLIDEKKRQSIISKYIKKLRIKTQNEQSKVGSLSGGNQQKVVIAKWLATNPKLLILDEPTRGVDVGARQEIYRVINDLAKEGLAIIMVSSDLPEVINMCDRVCVVKDGSIVTTLNKESLTQETIMRHATGG